MDAEPNSAPWLELRNVAETSAELYLYSVVGPLPGAANAIASLPGLGMRTLNVHITSTGGSVFSGFAVYNALNSYPGRVVVYVDGLAASVASFIAMAGDEIRMAQNAMLMIHAPSASASGGAEEMRVTADMLDKLTDSMRDAYAARSGLKPEAVAAYMATDSWFSADEALRLGLCTHVDEAKAATASFDLSIFKNVPAVLAATAKIMTTPETPAPVATVTTSSTTAEVFTADAVTAKVREATEAAHSAARTELDSVKAQHLTALNNLRAEKDNEIAGLKKKLTDAEALSVAHVGAPPVTHVMAGASAANKTPTTPSEILAHYRTLKGGERDKYFAKHNAAIWAAHDSEMQAAG